MHETPEIMFNSLQKIKALQFQDCLPTIKKIIQDNAFCFLSENLIYSMIKSSDELIRCMGWRLILSIREDGENRSPEEDHERRKTIPKINWDCNHWTSMIDLDPPTTKHFTEDQILSFSKSEAEAEPLTFPSHSQSDERSVKLVSEASKVVYGFDNRHKTNLTKVQSRIVWPHFMSKWYYSKNYDDFL